MQIWDKTLSQTRGILTARHSRISSRGARPCTSCMCYMHLRIFGRWSRPPGRDGLAYFRLMSRYNNNAHLQGLNPCLLTSKLHFIHLVLPTLLTYLRCSFVFFRWCLHWLSFVNSLALLVVQWRPRSLQRVTMLRRQSLRATHPLIRETNSHSPDWVRKQC